MDKVFETWERKNSKKFRQDLLLAAYAESLGYIVHCNPKHERDIPHMPIRFTKGNKVIWQAIVNHDIVWRCADIIDNRSKNHRSYVHLKTALEAENNENYMR